MIPSSSRRIQSISNNIHIFMLAQRKTADVSGRAQHKDLGEGEEGEKIFLLPARAIHLLHTLKITLFRHLR